MDIKKALTGEHIYEAGTFDVAVIGAGHAGCEAAHAAAALGLKTILFTLHLDAVANLPCNPSVGGTAKGQLVREIDALGGIMGKVADRCAIQMRMLNRSKGPAVFSPRAQMDRSDYSVVMKGLLEQMPGLVLRQAHITDILTDNGAVAGVKTEAGGIYKAKAIVLCSGTYMEARTIRGEVIVSSGPDGLPRSEGLSSSLAEEGIPLLRFKTGTPVRVNAGSVDFDKMDIQNGEDDIPPFSFDGEMDGACVMPVSEQIPCHSVWTTEETRKVITENMSRSPLYSGVITGTGPRYCPSIEDKFMRFADKSRHLIFVEPMGRNTRELYLQGFSTSLPEEVQEKMVKSLPGMDHAVIQRSAYAIEYDLIDPLSLKVSLESKIVSGLFSAGQVNGSSGYEEAAGQGIIAGINAAMKVMGKDPVIIDRADGYIGVLIDDLVTKGTNEPYRMMTSRAEYRLFLRQDNADRRLTPLGHAIGLISDERFERFSEKIRLIEEETARLASTYVAPSSGLEDYLDSVGQTPPKSGVSLAELIKRPGVTYEGLAFIDTNRPHLPDYVTKSLEVDLKYEGYLALEMSKIEKFKQLESKVIPEDIDYEDVKGLRIEARQKLSAMRPENIGRASRISGVSPADCEVLLVYMEALRRKNNE